EIRLKKRGSVVPDQTVERVVDTPSLAVVDGRFGYGQTVAPQAVKIGIEKCKASGLAAVALRNAGHIGRVGDWAEMAAAEGLVSVHFVNAAGSVLVAPYGGVERRMSTAPYCVGIPRQGQGPIVLDFATSDGTGATGPNRRFANGMFAIYVDPKVIDPGNFFDGEISRYVTYFKDTKPAAGVAAVLIPGEPEARMRAERTKNGVPLPDDTWAAI